MNRFLSGLFIATGAVVLAVGILAAVEIVLSNPKRPRRVLPKAVDEVPVISEPAVIAEKPEIPARKFSIKRTKSEVGFVYWILEGYGPYKCFVLCDTWDEAFEQAKAKVAEVEQTMLVHV